MTITLLFYVPPSLSPLPSSSSSSKARPYKYNGSSCPALTYPSPSRKLFVSLCSPPSTSTPAPVVDEQDLPSPDELPGPVQSEYPAAIQSGAGCKACGRQDIEKGCNGEGRIQGGIATVPGFGWWPIKAYRPCPGFVASGGRYRRQGQSMDEVAFGRGPTLSDSNPSTSSKK